MSRFIALLCAAAMAVSASAVVFAEDTDNAAVNDTVTEEVTEEVAEEATEAPAEEATEAPAEEATEAPAEEATEAPAEEATEDPAIGGVTFTDVAADAYYAEAVAYCYEKGLFNGMTDTEFEPATTMTRGMFATVFGRLQNADLTNVTLTYADVKADAYYAPYIAWATEQGIMDGYSDEAFGPDDAITREQAAKMIYSYLTKVKNITVAEVAAEYADNANVSEWAVEAISANATIGYLLADDNNNINPTAELTRADACFAVATAVKLAEAIDTIVDDVAEDDAATADDAVVADDTTADDTADDAAVVDDTAADDTADTDDVSNENDAAEAEDAE